MKTCFKCQTEKPKTDFYKHSQMGDGLLGKCKECTKYDSGKRFREKLQDPEWAIKERKRQREKEELRRIEGKVKKPTGERKDCRRPANHILGIAVRDGKIIPMPCEVCSKDKAQGHHEDYSKALDVTWLCSRHHADRHIHLRDRITLGQSAMPILDFVALLKARIPAGEKIIQKANKSS